MNTKNKYCKQVSPNSGYIIELIEKNSHKHEISLPFSWVNHQISWFIHTRRRQSGPILSLKICSFNNMSFTVHPVKIFSQPINSKAFCWTQSTDYKILSSIGAKNWDSKEKSK